MASRLLFNFQGVTAQDERWTNSDVLPISGGSESDLPSATSAGKLKHSDNSPVTFDEKNPNYGNPIQYQAPRIVRFGAKLTF